MGEEAPRPANQHQKTILESDQVPECTDAENCEGVTRSSKAFAEHERQKIATEENSCSSDDRTERKQVVDVVAQGRVVQAGHREELRASAVDHGNDSITVLLRFVDPGVTLRQFGNTLAFHRLDESRTQFGSDSNSLNHYRRTIFSHVLG